MWIQVGKVIIEKRIQPTKFRPPKIQILYLGVGSFITILCQGTSGLPLLRDCFLIFLKGFSKEIDHLTAPRFSELQNISGKI